MGNRSGVDQTLDSVTSHLREALPVGGHQMVAEGVSGATRVQTDLQPRADSFQYCSPGRPPWHAGQRRMWMSEPLAPYSWPHEPHRRT